MSASNTSLGRPLVHPSARGIADSVGLDRRGRVYRDQYALAAERHVDYPGAPRLPPRCAVRGSRYPPDAEGRHTGTGQCDRWEEAEDWQRQRRALEWVEWELAEVRHKM
ncbi:unnamed protein product [Phytophthora fragariaefolia]|uniref:Unnamed protein product n=1 Tax=Phytophthora fragariaefolia TaxID=1490495 RepID=A0A9W6YFD1_9STRA|nr:unnamed protein product [Phytophthora fragariaefolia]